MNELQVIDRNGVEVIDSREVAQMIGKSHAHLMRDISGYAQVLKKSTESKFGLSDFFLESTYKDSTGRTLPCYYLTKKGCDMVANKMTGEKGVLFTAAYVTAFERMREALTVALPKDYPSALRALAESVEQRQALEAQAEANAPKVLFADAVATSSGGMVWTTICPPSVLWNWGCSRSRRPRWQPLQECGSPRPRKSPEKASSISLTCSLAVRG